MRLRLYWLAGALLACGAPPAPAPPRAAEPPSACELTSADKPEPAPSSALPSLPQPKLEQRPPLRNGEAFTVWGAAYYLRSPVHRAEISSGVIAITGYIVKTNLPEAPVCAVHAGGKADPEDCRAELPTFWLGDQPKAPLADCIRVLGFASNYAQLHDAILHFESGKSPPEYLDALWGQSIPNPLPAQGARVIVRGSYTTLFAKATLGFVEDSEMGLLSYAAMSWQEHASVPAQLPGMKRKR